MISYVLALEEIINKDKKIIKLLDEMLFSEMRLVSQAEQLISEQYKTIILLRKLEKL